MGRMSAPRRLLLLLAAVLALAGCAGTSSEARPVAAEGWRGIEPSPVPERPSFVLTDTEGRPYDFRAETGGRPTYVFFGYTDCPDECPTARSRRCPAGPTSTTTSPGRPPTATTGPLATLWSTRT